MSNDVADQQAQSRPARRSRGPVLAVVVVVAIGLLWAFQPWKLFTSSTIDEALPTQTAPAAPGNDAGSDAGNDGNDNGSAGTGLVVVAEGDFVSQAHDTSGAAQLITLEDGSQVLRFENLVTDDGPDLHVWLTDQAAGGGTDVYDDGRYVKLGKLKATQGNQNYPIPAGADLVGLRSVVIWCDRFNTAFGSAPIEL